MKIYKLLSDYRGQEILMIIKSYSNSSQLSINQNNNKKPSNFKGNPAVALSSFIENNGFLGEFLTIDTVGMAAPRTIQGYARNSKELGHPNYKAGTEEIIREVLSGPAFFFVPLGTLGLSALTLGSVAKVENSTLDVFKGVMKEHVKDIKNPKKVQKDFISGLMNTAFKDYKNEKPQIKILENTLNNVVNGSVSKKEARKQVTSALTLLNKGNGKYLDNTSLIKIGKKEMDINALVADVPNYLKNFNQKAKNTTENATGFLEKFTRKAKNIRNIANILAVVALGAFLLIIPKIYQQDKKFPGTEGLEDNSVASSENISSKKDKKGGKYDYK